MMFLKIFYSNYQFRIFQIFYIKTTISPWRMLEFLIFYFLIYFNIKWKYFVLINLIDENLLKISTLMFLTLKFSKIGGFSSLKRN